MELGLFTSLLNSKEYVLLLSKLSHEEIYIEPDVGDKDGIFCVT